MDEVVLKAKAFDLLIQDLTENQRVVGYKSIAIYKLIPDTQVPPETIIFPNENFAYQIVPIVEVTYRSIGKLDIEENYLDMARRLV